METEGHAGGKKVSVGKYDPLKDYLSSHSGNEVVMSFDQLGRLVGGLPASAHDYDAWWANEATTGRHVQSHAWIGAGWQVAKVDRSRRQVQFSRVRVRPKALKAEVERKRAVWMSKGRFDDGEPGCTWGFEGRSRGPFAIPSAGSLLIVFDQDKLPVEMWEVGSSERLEDFDFVDGWTWFAESEMAELVCTTSNSGVRGIDFHEVAFLVLPPNGGWSGAPIELNDDQVEELFGQLGWATDVRCR